MRIPKLRFNSWGSRGDICLGRMRKYVYQRSAGSEIRTAVPDDVKCEGVAYQATGLKIDRLSIPTGKFYGRKGGSGSRWLEDDAK